MFVSSKKQTIKTNRIMTTLFQTANKEYFIEKNTNTFFVMDSAGQCALATSSAVKAKNLMNKVLYGAGLQERCTLQDLK